MLFHRLSEGALTTVEITATAFRDDSSAELVTITELSFDECRLSSRATFKPGERLRLYLSGQGWIEAQVQWTSGALTGVTFETESRV